MTSLKFVLYADIKNLYIEVLWPHRSGAAKKIALKKSGSQNSGFGIRGKRVPGINVSDHRFGCQ